MARPALNVYKERDDVGELTWGEKVVSMRERNTLVLQDVSGEEFLRLETDMEYARELCEKFGKRYLRVLCADGAGPVAEFWPYDCKD